MPRRVLFSTGWLLLAWVAGLGVTPAPAESWEPGPAWLTGAGIFGLKSHDDSTGILNLEYRFRPGWRGVFPLLGGIANGDGEFHVRAGLGRDFRLAPRWHVTLGSGVGYYERGNGKDLGGELEFRSSIDLTFLVRPHLRLGLSGSHLSNASLEPVNPGVETLELVAIWRRP